MNASILVQARIYPALRDLDVNGKIAAARVEALRAMAFRAGVPVDALLRGMFPTDKGGLGMTAELVQALVEGSERFSFRPVVNKPDRVWLEWLEVDHGQDVATWAVRCLAANCGLLETLSKGDDGRPRRCRMCDFSCAATLIPMWTVWRGDSDWTTARAQAAGVLKADTGEEGSGYDPSKDPWPTLWARAITEGARRWCAPLLSGAALGDGREEVGSERPAAPELGAVLGEEFEAELPPTSLERQADGDQAEAEGRQEDEELDRDTKPDNVLRGPWTSTHELPGVGDRSMSWAEVMANVADVSRSGRGDYVSDEIEIGEGKQRQRFARFAWRYGIGRAWRYSHRAAQAAGGAERWIACEWEPTWPALGAPEPRSDEVVRMTRPTPEQLAALDPGATMDDPEAMRALRALATNTDEGATRTPESAPQDVPAAGAEAAQASAPDSTQQVDARSLWRVTTKGDQEARAFFDGHYSRQTPGSPHWLRPGFNFVLRADDEAGKIVALFAWWRPKWEHGTDGTTRKDGLRALECTVFRRLGGPLASDLIKAAEEALGWPEAEQALHLKAAGPVPLLLTGVSSEATVDRRSKHSEPGQCFRAAGWVTSTKLASPGSTADTWLDRPWSNPHDTTTNTDGAAAPLSPAAPSSPPAPKESTPSGAGGGSQETITVKGKGIVVTATREGIKALDEAAREALDGSTWAEDSSLEPDDSPTLTVEEWEREPGRLEAPLPEGSVLRFEDGIEREHPAPADLLAPRESERREAGGGRVGEAPGVDKSDILRGDVVVLRNVGLDDVNEWLDEGAHDDESESGDPEDEAAQKEIDETSAKVEAGEACPSCFGVLTNGRCLDEGCDVDVAAEWLVEQERAEEWTDQPALEGRDPRRDPIGGDIVEWGPLPEHRAEVLAVTRREPQEGAHASHEVTYRAGGAEHVQGLGAWRSRFNARVAAGPDRGRVIAVAPGRGPIEDERDEVVDVGFRIGGPNPSTCGVKGCSKTATVYDRDKAPHVWCEDHDPTPEDDWGETSAPLGRPVTAPAPAYRPPTSEFSGKKTMTAARDFGPGSCSYPGEGCSGEIKNLEQYHAGKKGRRCHVVCLARERATTKEVTT